MKTKQQIRIPVWILQNGRVITSVFLVAVLGAGALATSFLVRKTDSLVENSKAATSPLTIDANTFVNNFSSGMLGQDYVNWMHSYGKPFLSKVPQLSNIVKEIKPGIIRYAGGNWSNSVGFDGASLQRSPYTAWTCDTTANPKSFCSYVDSSGTTIHDTTKYYFHYSTTELKSVSDYAINVNADVMIEVNVVNENPSMWANLVTYAKTNYPNFKYWEIGNEQDLSSGNPLSETEYATRFKLYQKAMLAANPNIQIIGPAAAAAVLATGLNSAINPLLTQSLQASREAGKDLSALTYHWYSQCNVDPTDTTKIFKYNWISSPLTSWRNDYSRSWGNIIPSYIKQNILNTYPNTELGVTEFNIDACSNSSVANGNHLAAIYFSDVIGRMAYSGVDFTTVWEGYSTESHAIIYPDSDTSPKNLYLRPTFNSYILYAKYFGNQMVKSTTYDDQNISIWASKDTNDPGKLKLIVTNLSATDISAPVNMTGFNAVSGQAYEMTNANPTDTSATSDTEGLTKINGVALHGMTLATDLASIKPINISISGSSITYNFKAYSSTSIILTQSGTATTTPITTTVPPTTSPVTTVPITTVAVSTTANPSCACGTNNLCSTTCTFSGGNPSNGNPSNVLSCLREDYKGITSTISPVNTNSFCNRNLRTKGDADGNGTINALDYFYYQQFVNGVKLPDNINPDFDGDSRVSVADRSIVINTLNSLP